MNKPMNTSVKNWERASEGPDASLSNRSAADIQLWWELHDRIIEIATENGWSKAEVARRIDMADGTFSQYFSGKYAGRLDATNAKVQSWLESVQEAAAFATSIPVSPNFLKTRIATEITETFTFSQMMGNFVMVTVGAGQGKTTTCNNYTKSRPNTYLVTISPQSRTVHGMLQQIAIALDIIQYNAQKLTNSIGRKLQRVGGGTLLIIDEAQNLTDDAINQLRHFTDVNQCGVALVGNNEIAKRFRSDAGDGRSNAQIRRRVAKRLNRLKPYREDIEAFIAAWGITDEKCMQYLTAIGMKPGALGQIDQTMKLASLIAAGQGVAVGYKHIDAAWKNRDVEEFA